MDTQNNPATGEKKQGRDVVYITIIILLLLTNGYTGWMWFNQKEATTTVIVEKEHVIVERDNVKENLEQLQEQYSTLQTTDKRVQGELEAKKAEIAELLVQAEKHKGDAYFISKLKKETETLRKIMKGFIVTIDSLNTLNKNLVVEKNQIKVELGNEQTKSSKLNKEKQDLLGVIDVGSILKGTAISVKGVRYKSGGKKELDTDKASRTEKLKVSFSLAENRIARKGDRDFFLRVLTPDGKELVKYQDEAFMFKFGGSRGYYAGKQSLNYNNEEISMTMYAEGAPENFVPGKYIVEIYSDGQNIGNASLTLK